MAQLSRLLRERLDVIADHAFRDRDPAAHLEALKAVSMEIDALHDRMRLQMPGELRHFLQQASYQKALAWLEARHGGSGSLEP